MTSVRAHIGVAVTVIGILVAADTLLLLYQWRSLFLSPNVLGITAGFVVLQEAILFGVLVYITMTAGRSSIALPVHLGYISVLVTSSLFAFFTIAVFDLLLMLGLVSTNAFWTALAMRQSTLLIFLLGIHIVGIVQRASHRHAEQQRAAVESLSRSVTGFPFLPSWLGGNLMASAEKPASIFGSARLCAEIRHCALRWWPNWRSWRRSLSLAAMASPEEGRQTAQRGNGAVKLTAMVGYEKTMDAVAQTCSKCGWSFDIEALRANTCKKCRSAILVTSIAYLEKFDKPAIQKYIAQYTRALKGDPGDGDALLAVGICYLKLGLFDLSG